MLKGLIAGLRQVQGAGAQVARQPIQHLALIGAIAVSALVTPVWGTTLTWIGWLEARRRGQRDGLAGLGALLAPARARALYAEGVWRGLWRVHGLSLAFALVQTPAVALALLPALLAFGLLAPVGPLFPDPMVGALVGRGVPALVALVFGAVVAGQTLLAWRVLGRTEEAYSLGLVYRVLGAAWRAALADLGTLLGIGAWLIVAAGLAAGLAYANLELAGLLKLGAGGGAIGLWTGVALGLAVVAVTLEALAQWADDAEVPAFEAAKDYSFTRWLRAWLGAVLGWFADQGVLAVGTGACLSIGVLTGLIALVGGRTFSSWIGLGWFAVTAAVLVALQWKERRT